MSRTTNATPPAPNSPTRPSISYAAQAADAEAAKTREQALDPAVVVDAAKVGAAIVAAELVRDRFQAALPRLRTRYGEVHLQEDVAKWNAEAAKLKERRDELVTEFARLLPVELVKQIVAALVAMREFDQKISAHNWYKPDDRGARLLPRATPTFADELKIPDMEGRPGAFLWPPPATNLSFGLHPDPFVIAHAGRERLVPTGRREFRQAPCRGEGPALRSRDQALSRQILLSALGAPTVPRIATHRRDDPTR